MKTWRINFLIENKRTGFKGGGYEISEQPDDNDMQHIPSILTDPNDPDRTLTVTIEQLS